MVNSVPEPKDCFSSGMRLLTSFETSTVFALGSFVTAMVNASLPLTRLIVVGVAVVNSTVATSAMVTSPPVFPPISGSADTWSTDVKRSPETSVSVLSSSVI
ncbi:unannotated protein [freshwater metagenome]|uniref:Unannotated protein n=1 Tax=freshwater metagenome TaxID=449393 RepID=A0A6J6E6D2_9ZZZZ